MTGTSVSSGAKEVYLTGTGLYTPPNSISNEELVESFNQFVDLHNAEHADAIAAGDMPALAHSSAEFIEKASGIRSRFVVNKEGILDPHRMTPNISERPNDEPSVMCEMALIAAREALKTAGLEPEDLDAVICAASNMQRAYPAMAVEIQSALGSGGFAFDMNVACSSATFGLQQARDAIRSGSARHVLVVNPEICTGHLNFRDRDSHFIFGDVCTAMILSDQPGPSESNFRVLDSRLQTMFSNNIRNNFGFLNRGDETGVGKADKLFVQEGRKVFKEVCPAVAAQINDQLASLDIASGDLKRLWLHQANLNMNVLIAKRVLGRDATTDEAPVILDEYANTSSAGSVIAFHKHHDDFDVGELGVLSSFGAGYSIGSVVLQRC
ncbi:beta-ketoacyl-ACP synthase III [Congregibacter litoralis]|uniref:3-oxoacyl-[acyl-carrier-protein] synthase III n=1 Tax=Congregibacter litoralis KT71 TaxID=314285 RepID=A4A3L2_9GAMM|nr:beta-ketoacyl-ACP synthase III [Congregibacter litoralis]EAQ99285.1 3-oxoacyl-[acyl-carrier-protein] synthase III [Congregibacter litoralis KT71]